MSDHATMPNKKMAAGTTSAALSVTFFRIFCGALWKSEAVMFCAKGESDWVTWPLLDWAYFQSL